MENVPEKKSGKLVRIEELYSDVDLAIKETELQVLLNQNPSDKWIREHPLAKKKVRGVEMPMKYLPIERVEWLAISIFGGFRVEVKEVQLIANAVAVTVRVFVKNPLTGLEEYQDGVGAVGLQTDKNASATDWTKIKSAAVQMALPAAKTYAEKDAFEAFGKIFGRDINRDGELVYDNLTTKFSGVIEARQAISEALDQIQDEDMKQGIIDRITLEEAKKRATLEFYQNILEEIQHGR
jgi:hypothetical protein